MINESLQTEILGSFMFAPEKWDEFGGLLTESMFTTSSARELFNAIRAVADEGKQPDVFEVVGYIQANGGRSAAYAEQAGTNVWNVAQLGAKCKLLADQRLAREVQAAGRKIAALDGSGAERHAAMQAILDGLDKGWEGEAALLSAGLDEWFSNLAELAAQGAEVVGLETGFQGMDRRIGGLRDTDMIVLAGRPSMGKTALGMNIMSHVAQSAPVGVFSMEMSEAQLMDRLVANYSGVPLGRVRTPANLQDGDWPKLTRAMGEVKARKIVVDDRPSLRIGQIRNAARMMKRRHGVRAIMVDYIQLAHPDRYTENRKLALAQVSAGLKGLAKELEIPVIVLAQLNRECEKRGDKRPLQSDLAECGNIEQDADAIGFIYRDEVYNPDSPQKGFAELLWRKVRNGESGVDYMRFNGALQRFTQCSRDDVPMKPQPVYQGPYGEAA